EYDYNYQYDGTGSRAGRNMNTNALRAANVFTSQRAETLKAVSFSLFENADVAYTVSVYLNPSDPQHPDSGTLAAQVSGATGYAGLYTVALDAPVTLGQGTVFAIVVELSGETPLILPADEDNEDLAWVHFTAQSSAGQSFVSADGLSWTDVGAAQDGYNLRIKGYTTENNDRGRITVASFENAVSSSGQLACRALLQGVTGAPVWSIVKGEATVDQTGVVTALGPGEVTVRAAVGDVYGEKTITVNSGKGTGTALDPHRIYTASDLLNVRNDRAAAYKLMNDITLSGSSRPLGDSAETRFSGIFDGQGYAIRNLNLTANGLGGLFGYLYKAEIRDLSLPGGSATVLGHSEAGENLYIGALAGYAFESTIVRCQSDLAVHAEGGAGDWLFAGGLVGRTQGGAMTDCGFSGPIEIKGSAPVAHSGLVAQADDTVFENCFISTGALADKVDSVSVLNCYDTQGAHGAAALNSAAFASGEAALLLQNGRSTPVWGQQIKSQAVPHLGAEAVAQFRAVHYLQAVYADEYEQKTDDPVFLNAARALLQGRRSFNGFVLANSEQDGQTLTYVYHRRVYEVQFDGGSISVPSARVRHGARVNSPYVEREGYTLGGWYTEDGTLYDFSLPVTQALALSARWSPIPGAETDAPLPPAGP
ncbi:MAG: InlB B-repeat-containing protein, partial [Clostridia bacterium]|nr:InlB B-repeat-containing protein [Clostridia bacterium]